MGAVLECQRVPSQSASLARETPTRPLDDQDLTILESLSVQLETFSRWQTTNCVICNVSIFKEQNPVCSTGLHAVCTSCFESYAKTEQELPEAVTRERKARLLCPCRFPHKHECKGVFNEQTIASFLPTNLFSTHMERQREQMQATEFAKANNMLTNLTHQLQQHLVRDMPGISRKLLERQLKQALPGARQCGRCGHGPIEHYACDDLLTHQGQVTGNTKINNACPKCGWFRPDSSQWPRWDGNVHPEVITKTNLDLEKLQGR